MSYNKDAMKRIIDKWSGSKWMRIFLTCNFAILFTVLFPLMIVATPLVLAWNFSGALLGAIYKQKIFGKFDTTLQSSKWGDFIVDLQQWEDMDGEA